MTITITLIGASTFLLSEILKNKGYTQISKSILPITTGLTGLTIITKLKDLFL